MLASISLQQILKKKKKTPKKQKKACKLNYMLQKRCGFGLFLLLCIHVAPSQEAAQVVSKTPGSSAVIRRALNDIKKMGTMKIRMELVRLFSGVCVVPPHSMLYCKQGFSNNTGET